MRTARALLVVACCLAGPAGCRESPSETPPPASGVPAVPASAAVLVPHARLAAEIPDLDGWQRDAPASALVSLPAPASHASATYARGNARIDLEITDTGGDPAHVEPLTRVAGTLFIQKASNGYMKGTTLAGYPAVESWNHTDRLGDISVLISGRFVVHATGTGLDGVATLQQAVHRVDLAKIAGMK